MTTFFGQRFSPLEASIYPSWVPMTIPRRIGKVGDSYNRADDSYEQESTGEP